MTLTIGVKEGKVRVGDWVTLSRAYAEKHGDGNIAGDYRVIEERVPASQLYWDGNDINEWGFDDGKEYKYKNTENNRKLNDLVTRDDDGNVIPPSRRFDEENSDVRFKVGENRKEGVAERRLRVVNYNFNEELSRFSNVIKHERYKGNENVGDGKFNGKPAKEHIFQLGMPSDALLSAGVQDLPLELSASTLIEKSSEGYKNNHPFSLESIEDLPTALAHPIAVFKSAKKGDNGIVILTDLKEGDDNFVVIVRRHNNVNDIEVNSVRSIYPKDSKIGIIKWVEMGLLEGVDKKKFSGYLSTQWPDYIAGQEIKPEIRNRLISAAKVVEDFDSTKSFGEKNGEKNANVEVNATTADKVALAEQDVDTNPTEAQKEAGNYRKGHVKVDGMDVSIENPKGSVRSGKGAKGREWSVTMNNTYGYIGGTKGKDGDHIGIFLSDSPDTGDVYVVDQVNPETGEFDEHKVMYGFANEDEARKAYLSNYEEGWKGLGNITRVDREEFKKWLNSSTRKTKPFAEYKSMKPAEGLEEYRVGKNREAEEIIDRARRDGTLRKAPNGKPSRLAAVGGDELWARVRTPQFKSWFGDWEKGEGSKVLDENGEPLVVFHGSRSGGNFTVFGGESFFTDNRDVAEMFRDDASYSVSVNGGKPILIFGSDARQIAEELTGGDYEVDDLTHWGQIDVEDHRRAIDEMSQMDKDVLADLLGLDDFEQLKTLKIEDAGPVFETFLNIRNPLVVDFDNEEWSADKRVEPSIEEAKKAGHDGIIVRNIVEGGPAAELLDGREVPPATDFVTFGPNQIKNIDNDNPTESPDIRYRVGGSRVDRTEIKNSKQAYDFLKRFDGRTFESGRDDRHTIHVKRDGSVDIESEMGAEWGNRRGTNNYRGRELTDVAQMIQEDMNKNWWRLRDEEPQEGLLFDVAGDRVEDGASLVGVHNISAEKLMKAIKLGGSVNPSIAVYDTKKNYKHTRFSEISLIAPSSMMDEATTYIGDAYTGTVPTPVYRPSDEGREYHLYRLTEYGRLFT